MRRDMELVRKILLRVEGEETIDLSAYTGEQVEHHFQVLEDAGLIADFDIGIDGGTEAEDFFVDPPRLTWGHRHGLLKRIPHIEIPTPDTPARGRPITDAEFAKMVEAVPAVVGEDRAAPWCYLLRGLFLGGLRIGEAVKLSWDDPEGVRVDLEREYPLMCIPARFQKGKRETITPITPDFVELLKETPEAERRGLVFKLDRVPKKQPEGKPDVPSQLSQQQVEKMVRAIGKKSGVIVKRSPVEYVSAHDLRRSFCFRWSQRVLPQVLRTLARHRTVQTTLSFYAEADAAMTAEAVWSAVRDVSANKMANSDQSGRKPEK